LSSVLKKNIHGAALPTLRRSGWAGTLDTKLDAIIVRRNINHRFWCRARKPGQAQTPCLALLVTLVGRPVFAGQTRRILALLYHNAN
jgi:hypothetical protein